MVIPIPICVTGIPGSMDAVATTLTVPLNVMHWAIPLLLMVTPIGAAMVMGSDNDHITCGVPVIGGMLNLPVAVNWTCLFVKFCAIADCGVTMMLCS